MDAPSISVIVPCFNESATIRNLLEALWLQTVGTDDLEVIVADGGSTDGTRQVIREYGNAHSELRVHILDNTRRTIPAALNLAIAASSGEVLVRLDAHSEPARDYIERCLETLDRTGAANVGGRWEIKPSRDTWIARSIAAAAAHRLGAGGASYRVGGEEGPADTVPFGCFQRRWVERIGRFNEKLMTNEDYEFNYRIRMAGGVVWFNPRIRSVYYARPTISDLIRQYARYGYWKAQMVRMYPGSIRPRQALPPLFALSLVVLGVLSFLWPFLRILLAVESIGYIALLSISAFIQAYSRRDLPLLVGFATATMLMHLSWGWSFLWGILKPPS